MIIETAPAKINLYLHVGGVRDDGLHELASLFVFTCDGDKVAVTPAGQLSLQVEGAFAPALKDLPTEQNLIWQAATLLREKFSVTAGAAMVLEKNLPIAAGIGGGSADAAAALRALVKLWQIDISEDALTDLAFGLGADIPACLSVTPVNVAGAGEVLTPGPSLPPLWVCLVNPGVEMPTGPVFRAFDASQPSPAHPQLATHTVRDLKGVSTLMFDTRNDLEPMARAIAPEISATLDFLENQSGVLSARMSGSGATCFALFPSFDAASFAQKNATANGWWALASALSMR